MSTSVSTRVDPVGYGCDEIIRKGCGHLDVCALHQFGKGKLGRPVDGDEEIELAPGGPQFGNAKTTGDSAPLFGRIRCGYERDACKAKLNGSSLGGGVEISLTGGT